MLLYDVAQFPQSYSVISDQFHYAVRKRSTESSSLLSSSFTLLHPVVCGIAVYWIPRGEKRDEPIRIVGFLVATIDGS